MSGIFDEIDIKESTGEVDLSDNPIVEIYNNSIQGVLCTTARFVLSTEGTSYCGCSGTGPDAQINCHCRAGSVGLNDDATSTAPYACRIPIITSVGVIALQKGMDATVRTVVRALRVGLWRSLEKSLLLYLWLA